MKIVIPGGSGQVGTVLARAFQRDGHDVVVLSRLPRVEPWRAVEWDGRTLGGWRNEIEGSDVVIKLDRAQRELSVQRGESCRDPRVAGVVHSRCRTGHRTGDSCSTCLAPGEHGDDYAHRYDGPNDETSGGARWTGDKRAEFLEVQHRRREGLGTDV